MEKRSSKLIYTSYNMSPNTFDKQTRPSSKIPSCSASPTHKHTLNPVKWDPVLPSIKEENIYKYYTHSSVWSIKNARHSAMLLQKWDRAERWEKEERCSHRWKKQTHSFRVVYASRQVSHSKCRHTKCYRDND